ncbi:ATP-grasp ribosomal peptide maturase [Embleya sp. NPDC005971]|uniref:ATP-grasp ribosomal peptide maturase n=1 Tax=Embleya sp. NPDC005971 TaxID=3156724 RepID=UPI0033D7AD13
MVDRPVVVVTGIHDTTADWVIEELHDRHVPVVRLDPADIGDELVLDARIGGDTTGWTGRLATPSRRLDLSGARSLYYRRPSPYSTAYAHLDGPDAAFAENEARYGLGGVLSALPGCLYVNHSADIARAELKPAQLQAAARLGFAVPPTLITNDLDAAREFAAAHGPVVYKPLRSPRIHAGQARTIWAQQIDPESLDATIVAMPHLLQARTPKVADLRVTVVGAAAFTVRIESALMDWRANAEEATCIPVPTPPRLAFAMRAYLDEFRLIFGCFDFGVTASGEIVFYECNANGQWAWLPGADAMAAAFADVLQRGL